MASKGTKSGKGFRWLVTGVVIGLVIGGWFWRDAVRSIARNATSYGRRRARVKNPVLIINPLSGDGKAVEVGLADAARKRGISVVTFTPGDDLAQTAHDAISAGADAIGMAGGDGSLASVAAVSMQRGVPFFCVPVGTRNHFALDLGLDRDDPLAALESVPTGDVIKVDVGEANGRVFINNVSLGVYAMAVHEDGYRASKAETISSIVRQASSDPEVLPRLRFGTPDGKRHERPPLVMVSNNRYEFSGPPDYGRRPRMNTGKLGITALTSMSGSRDLAIQVLADLPNLQDWQTGSFRVESDDVIQAGVDGEATQFTSPLDFVSRAKSLRVLVPSGTKPGYLPRRDAVAARFLDLAHLGGEDDEAEGIDG